jgi:hypothetical protein
MKHFRFLIIVSDSSNLEIKNKIYSKNFLIKNYKKILIHLIYNINIILQIF